MINRRTASRMKQYPAVTGLCILIVLCCVLLPTPCFSEKTSHLSMGYMGSVYQEMTNKDINAAVSVLIEKIAWKYFERSEAIYYDNIAKMAADLKSGKLQVACLPPEEFMQLRNLVPLDPLLMTSTSTGHETELLLLVRKDSGIRSLKDLKNKSIAMPRRNPRVKNMFRVWVETMLMREGYKDIDSFFSKILETDTTARVVMPVFFRQADACVVTRRVFDLTSELNPQIGRELKVIASVGKLAQGIISVNRELPEETKEKIRQSFLILHESPDGRQMLLLFQVSNLIPFRPEYLKATEELFSEHRRLQRRFSRKAEI